MYSKLFEYFSAFQSIIWGLWVANPFTTTRIGTPIADVQTLLHVHKPHIGLAVLLYGLAALAGLRFGFSIRYRTSLALLGGVLWLALALLFAMVNISSPAWCNAACFAGAALTSVYLLYVQDKELVS